MLVELTDTLLCGMIATTTRGLPCPARERVIYTNIQSCSWLNSSSILIARVLKVSDPEQAGLRKSPSSPDHGARSSTAVLALCLSGRGRYLGNLRHLSGKRDAWLLQPGRAEHSGAFAGDELSPGRRPSA